jgi:hypothetical protein
VFSLLFDILIVTLPNISTKTVSSRLADQTVHYDPDCEASVVAGGADEVNARIKVKRSHDGFGNDIYTR